MAKKDQKENLKNLKNQENLVNKRTKNAKKEKEKKFTILGMGIYRLLAYFIIYSVAGFLIETLFGLVTKGVIESRQSFLYGPFCAIYGVGAVIMIGFLQYFKKNNWSLFFGGFVVGSVVEYLVSLFGELILHVKWWDYSNMPLNINGRICVYFSFFWGMLAIFLMTYINPKVDKLIEFLKSKFSLNFLKFVTIFTTIFMFGDCVFTGVGLRLFYARIEQEKHIEIQEIQDLIDYNKLQKDPKFEGFVNKYLNDKKMLLTFPNLKIMDKNGNIIFVRDLYPDIQPYYVKVFNPKGTFEDQLTK